MLSHTLKHLSVQTWSLLWLGAVLTLQSHLLFCARIEPLTAFPLT